MRRRTKIGIFIMASIFCVIALFNLAFVLMYFSIQLFPPDTPHFIIVTDKEIIIRLSVTLIFGLLSYWWFDKIPFKKK